MTTKPKYPVAGDKYSSALYPGQVCRVISVLEGQVAFEWIGQYAYVEEQTVSVKKFVIDFRLLETSAKE